MLKKYIPEVCYVEIDGSITVRELLAKLKIPEDLVAGVIVDGKVLDKSQEIKDGQEVALMAPIAGG
ncbi:MAG: MoaD/ThiS family protein [Synergistetes bacterium]|nr:MoaD/ThiS family protein [Synergistota bacterium]MDW8192545.1 MoaD/ThiS family protein [Synergistota bacterium]